jgi:hypothetical protein
MMDIVVLKEKFYGAKFHGTFFAHDLKIANILCATFLVFSAATHGHKSES